MLHYQLQFALDDGRPVGAEALLRWPREDGLWLPGRFIGLIDEGGMTVALGERVIAQAIAQLRENLDICAELNLLPQWWVHRVAIHLLSDLWSNTFHEKVPLLPAGGAAASGFGEHEIVHGGFVASAVLDVDRQLAVRGDVALRISEVELEDVRRELTNTNVFVWVGLHDPSVETIRDVQEAFDLHELAIEDAFAEHQRAKVESYGNDSVFVVVRTAKLTDNTIRYGTTAIFMGKQYIITIRQGASHSYESVREFCHRRPEKLRLGPIFVLHAILDFIVDNYLPITEKLGRYLREQEREIFSDDFDKQTLRNLYELKSQLVHMRAVILPVQDICNFFINHKKTDLIPSFPSQAKPYFRDVNDHLLRALDAVNGLNEMLSVAMDTYMAVATMGQNDVVRKLAAWAGILAVPTAMAGIYGMNFENMPELKTHYGYFILLAVIITICVTLYYRFRKAGWL